MIAYYDRLSSSSSGGDTNNSNHSNCNGNDNRPAESPTASCTSHSHSSVSSDLSVIHPVAVGVESSESISRVKSERPPLPTLPPPSIRLQCASNRRNFRILSPNVQRIISHSNTAFDTVPVDTVAMDEAVRNESFLHERRTNASLAKLPHGSKFKHPLSKNTCKLSQAGSDLVIDDSDGGYATPSDLSEIVDARNNNHCDRDGGSDDDDHDKTPTNENLPEIDFAAATVADDGVAAATANAEHDENCNQVLDESKRKLCAIVIDSTGDDENKDCVSNGPAPPPPTPATPTTPSAMPNYPKNSGSFLHSMFAKNNDEKSSPKDERRMSQFYVDHGEDVPNAVPAGSSAAPETTPVANENAAKDVEIATPTDGRNTTTVDLKRTKSRPLSSVSISSTSSSSSSGSDEMSPNITAISYLASVESLADHSETESHRVGNSITVLERSCMEIVDSEQNYVDDLCQVING